MSIPKIIHRIWVHDPSPEADPMPEEFRGYGRRWKELHPAWTVLDRTSLADLVPLRNQAAYDAATGKDYRRYRADLLRLELLWRFGGVYVDTDCEPLKPFDDLLEGVEAFVALSPNPAADGTRIVTNAVMGAAPGHPFIDAAIRRIPESVRDFAGKHTAIAVGPYHLQRVIDAGEGFGVKVFDAELFYPQSIRDREDDAPIDLSRAYAWHRWANTRKRRHERRARWRQILGDAWRRLIGSGGR